MPHITVAPLAGLLALVAVPLALPISAPAQARSVDQQMMMMPSERIEQRCNARAMGEVGRANKALHPDELVAYAYADPVIKGWSIKAPGGAVRSGATWYHIAYECETAHEGLDVTRFRFTLGAAIPTSEWSGHYLVAP
ncbi:uncharacterized protein DUF930 [Ancylobacter aquaticus]|uniref:Uncharacterized protein DUF930 n=1 Tax=Ancylobacter aquaticus TaxID=100 RepID=A0A4R1H991_ANCAQ|nr:DUF930 domain-containing protein [Ancylobacter aquaticus]TCK16685.1 uncharacterized protein DUF930 [Ancylobacter aquaticus]